MLQRFKNDEGGFTLIELLVVILIVGILAAIALPTFLGQQKKGQDASAKSDLRNAVSQMESCYTDAQTYVGCPNTDSPISPDVTPANASATGYDLTEVSKSGTTFTLNRDPATGTYARGCDAPGKGGCKSDSSW